MVLNRMKYEQLKHNIPYDVRNTIRGSEIIQGERSLEAQLPDRLKRETTDYDVYSKNPKKSAIQTERYLDKEFGGNYFKVKAGKHKGTYKVVSNIDNETYVDFTKPTEKTPNIKIGETRYTTLRFELIKALRTLKNKQYTYRHAKEENKIKRLKEYFKSRW